MNILLKYPTRGRPALFLQTLRGWLFQAENAAKLSVLVSCDIDDETMTDDILVEARRMHYRTQICRGPNTTKIEACNADLATCPFDWQIVLLISDDMICRQPGWDAVVRESMRKCFPDTDGALWFHDGRQRAGNTLECVGRKRYEHFGYLYHPSYRSFGCDDEATIVGQRDGKLVYFEPGICTHEHPSMGGSFRPDPTYLRNNKWIAADSQNLLKRQAAGFPR